MADIYSTTAQDTISPTELELYHAIMDYRDSLGLAPIPLSANLSATAGRHALDTVENIWRPGLQLPDGANLHSWSDAPYYGDHRAPEVMWYAPARLGLNYPDPGFEISAAGYPTVQRALSGWQSSSGHDPVITNSGIWARYEWQAIGVGVELNQDFSLSYQGNAYHVWFGAEPDPDGPPLIQGTAANETMKGTAFADLIHAGEGNDSIAAGLGDDTLLGQAGHDTLDGGPGADRLVGGQGSDAYHVDNPSDTIVELAGQGNDHVFSSVSFALRDHSQHLEVLWLTGSGNIDGTGNGRGNLIFGNAGNNALNGAYGNDTLYGGLGNDTLRDDSGEDRLFGGMGHDAYHVDSPGDTIVELAGQGNDHVFSSISLALRDHGQHLEVLWLTGSGNIDGTGNGQANLIFGNAGDNVLNGAFGNDALYGGPGNDRLFDESGADRFVGGLGDDVFAFRSLAEIVFTPAARDVIADFQPGRDVIDLSGIDANVTLAGNQAFTFVGDAAHSGAGATLRYGSGTLNTYVYGDVDGDGVGDFTLQLDGVHSLTAADFVL